jgi:hypothetical protein
VGDVNAFAETVAHAVRETGFSGSQAMVIIDHRNLLFHVQDTPPAEGKVVDQILERLVGRGQFFEEKAAWGRLALPESKGRHRHLLALLPESLIQGLVTVFAAHRLELTGVFPIAAVLGDQLRLLAAQEGEAVLLAADLGDAIHLLLGTGDGQVLFSRTVAIGGQQPAERAAQEISRTLHYAQQQFGAAVNKLFVYGARTFQLLKNFPIRSGLAIAPSPVAEDPLYFARQVFLLSPKLRLNFLPPSALKKKSNRQIAAALIVALATGSISTTIVTEIRVRARERALINQVQQSSAEAEIRNRSVTLENEATRWRALRSAIGSTNDPPVPELLIRHLANALPEAARLSRVDVQQATNGWHVRLEGFVVEASGEFVEVISTFENRLSSDPFRLRIQDGTRRQLTHGGAGRAVSGQRPGGRDNERAFFIEGVIE